MIKCTLIIIYEFFNNLIYTRVKKFSDGKIFFNDFERILTLHTDSAILLLITYF